MSASQDDYTEYYQRTLDLPSPARYEWFLKHVPVGGNILDFGAGTGRFAAAFIRDRPDIRVDVLDNHPQSLFLLRPQAGIHHLYEQSFEQFAPVTIYDAIWAKDCLFFVPPDALDAVLARLCGALKPSGRLMATFLEDDEKPHPLSEDFYRLSEQHLRNLFTVHGFSFELFEAFEGFFGEMRTPASCFLVCATCMPK